MKDVQEAPVARVIGVHPTLAERVIVNRAAFEAYFQGVPGVISWKLGEEYSVHRTHLPLWSDIDVRFPVPTPKSVTKFGDGTVSRPWQRDITDYIRSRHGTYLAWAMRTGKTGASLLAHRLEEGAVVILGPLQSRGVWMNWCHRRWPRARVGCVVGTKFDPAKLRGFHALFIHYEIAAAWQSLQLEKRIGRPVGTVILDEAHLLANPKSLRTQAALFLATNAKRVIALSGTPLFNSVAGIYSVLSILNPGAWGSDFDFAKRYSGFQPGAHGWELGPPTHEEEFQARLSEVASIKRWEDVVDQVPAVTRRVVTVPLDADKTLQIAKLAEVLRKPGRRSTIGEIAHMRRILGSVKVETATREAVSVLEDGRPVVIWTWHHEVAKGIAKRLQKVAPISFIVTGEDTVKHRDATIDAWKCQFASPLIIAIPVGQVAIDLSHADECVFAEQDWTPAMVSQAEMRTFAPTRPMNVTHVVVEHEVDLRIVNALVNKCNEASQIGLPCSDTSMDFLSEALGMQTLDGDFAGLLDFSEIGAEIE